MGRAALLSDSMWEEVSMSRKLPVAASSQPTKVRVARLQGQGSGRERFGGAVMRATGQKNRLVGWLLSALHCILDLQCKTTRPLQQSRRQQGGT
jgi:hypothetical protein